MTFRLVRTSTAFSLVSKRLLIRVCRIRTVYSMANQDICNAKRDIQSWISETNKFIPSPAGSWNWVLMYNIYIYSSWKNQQQEVRLWRELNPGLCGPKDWLFYCCLICWMLFTWNLLGIISSCIRLNPLVWEFYTFKYDYIIAFHCVTLNFSSEILRG